MTVPRINRRTIPLNNIPSRTPVIAGNWKMNQRLDEGLELVEVMLDDLDAMAGEGIEVVLCPPFISLYPLLDILEDTNIQLGAQNMFYQDKGAFTGEISPLMLSELCDYVILGHSERRTVFGESDELINKKVKAALKHDLRPILAVGENALQRSEGETESFITVQLRSGLYEVEAADMSGVIIAYEPLWAIGSGTAATGPAAQEVCALIRGTLSEMYGWETASQVRIQYGGSVTSQNIQEYMRQPDIDGALVGGASLKAEDFVGIVAKTLELSRRK